MTILRDFVVGFDVLMLTYFVLINIVYTVLAIIGWRAVERYVSRRPLRDYQTVSTSHMSPPVTILVPGYNEESVIAASVRSLLSSHFAELEVMVINDGSSDGTLDVLKQEFALVEVERVPRAGIETAPVRATYTSGSDSRLTVVDKENGGKADSLNAGLCYAAFPLVCAIDADTILDPEALARLVWEFEASPDTVAAGGIVRIVNGSTWENGRLAKVQTPRNLLLNLQILEYLRAFLGGRIAWSRLGMLLIISGAFGIFRRDALVEVGGYDPTTVGEDAEVVLRLHRRRREAGKTCRIIFFPDPICWTEAPSSLRVLIGQRDRWQRGLFEMLRRHHEIIGRRQYGTVGLLAMPYFLVFEAIGPVLEATGYVFLIASVALGWISWGLAAAFAALSLTYGLVLSFLTLLMEERAFQRYPDWRDLGRLVFTAVAENYGYRQLIAFVRARALWTLWRGRGTHSWGQMTRAGFGSQAPPP